MKSVRKYKTRHKARFQNSSVCRSGNKIKVDGNIVTNPSDVVQAWKEHFENLGQTRKHSEKVIEVADGRANTLLPLSFRYAFPV